MKKLISSIFSALILAILLVSLMFSNATAASQAQGTSPQADSSNLSFGLLGRTDTLMRGPFHTTNLRFSLPANWALQEGASLQLVLTSSVVTEAANPVAEGQPLEASLSVTFNRKLVAMIPLVVGTNIAYELPIQADALVPSLGDGRHVLELFLDASTDCDPNRLHQTSVVVSSASQFAFPYTEQSPVVDLTQFPRPIYQRDSVFPMNAVMMVPEEPSAQEMQAALITAASFGRFTEGKLPLSLVSESQITEEILADSNLIFVGKASALSMLKDLTLPAPLTNNAFNPQGSQSGDGIIQVALSPWNPGRSVMILSGNTDASVVKAAQALSHGNIQTLANSDLAIVTDVALPNVDDEGLGLGAAAATHTFKDLGYDIATLTGVGRNDFFVDFYVTPGLVASEGAYLDLMLNNSALLDFDRSGLTLYLNGNLLSSLRFSDQTAATTTQRIMLSPSLVHPGSNQLRIQADMSPLHNCSLAYETDLWASIFPESSLYLPLQQAPIDSNNLQNLGAYPSPFVNVPTLSDTAFVLPKSDLASWAVASQIAYGLGNQARGAILDLAVAYDDAVPEEIRNARDLIVVGLPADLKLLSELKDLLPAPFESGQNMPVLNNQQVTYRFEPGASIGYLQLVASPWNPSRTILTVVGSTPEGVQMAGNALTDPTLRSRLAGNFALVNADNISSMDTRSGLGMGGIAVNPAVTSQPVVPVPPSGPVAAPVARPFWILPAAGVLGFLILVVLIFALISGRREARRK